MTIAIISEQLVPPIVVDGVSWLLKARCATEAVDPGLFEERDRGEPQDLFDARDQLVREVCDACPVKAQCLERGTSDPDAGGFYAGEYVAEGRVYRRCEECHRILTRKQMEGWRETRMCSRECRNTANARRERAKVGKVVAA